MDHPKRGFWGGRIRTLEDRTCACGTNFLCPPYRTQKYCSRGCSDRASQEARETQACAFCGAMITRLPKKFKSPLSFCGRSCKDKAQRLSSGILKIEHYQDGRASYRPRAFAHLGPRCMVCGYDEDPRMLDVDHIDGNRANNDLHNLQVLCVWDHAVKTRLGKYVKLSRGSSSIGRATRLHREG